MTTRTFVTLCALGALAVACGPRSRTPESTAAAPTKVSRNSSPLNSSPLSSSLAVETSDGVHFSFNVANNSGKKIELLFPNGQTHDVAVLDANGREVWRWSQGRMFTQSLQTKLLSHGSSISYDERWANAPAGRYTAVATLNSEKHALESRAEFIVAQK